MLSEQVLEELARNAPLQKLMVETAWPNLCVESKLQVIHAVQDGETDGTPTWLMELCIADPSPIVRYWAARRYPFAPAVDRVMPEPFTAFNRPTPENEKLLRTKATADSSELVRACVAADPWEAGAPLNRMVFARNKGTAHLICGLNKAFDTGISDEDLSSALREVLQKPEVQADLKFKGMYSEGDTAYYEGQVVTDGWSLARKAGPKVQSLLTWALPTDRGLAQISPADLATMPADVLTSLAYRRDKTKEIVDALKLVLSTPEKYEESVIESIQNGLEVSADYEDGVGRGKHSIDRGQETLDQVQALQAQLQGLVQQVATLHELASVKRGWFS